MVAQERWLLLVHDYLMTMELTSLLVALVCPVCPQSISAACVKLPQAVVLWWSVMLIAPLLGPSGAAYIFAPQKGADAAQVKLLEQALTHYASIFKQTIACDKSQLPGAGSAGGTGYGLAMALDAPVVSGFDWLSQMLNLEQKLEQCDAIVVAEGRIDSQSFDSGKAVGRLVSRAQALHKKVYALPAITSDEDFDNGNITRLIQSSHYADSGQADIAAVKLATKALLS
jgi:glycerate kinase